MYSRARRPSAWIDELGDGSALDGLDVGGAAVSGGTAEDTAVGVGAGAAVGVTNGGGGTGVSTTTITTGVAGAAVTTGALDCIETAVGVGEGVGVAIGVVTLVTDGLATASWDTRLQSRPSSQMQPTAPATRKSPVQQ